MKKIIAFLLAFACFSANANTPYDATADAAAELKTALNTAKTNHKNVLVIFGANWCKDCLELDKSLKNQNAGLINNQFVVVKVDVGQFDKNLNLANDYGNPIKKGIPAAVVLKPDNTLLYSTKAGELSNARRMGDQGIADFFQQVIKDHP